MEICEHFWTYTLLYIKNAINIYCTVISTLMGYLLKTRELDNSPNPNWTRAKGSPPEKNTTTKKELLTQLWVTLQKGDAGDSDDDDKWEPVEPITSPWSMWQRFGVLRVEGQKLI